MKIRCARNQRSKLIRMRATSRPVDHTHSFRERRARRRGRPGLRSTCPARSHRCARPPASSGSAVSLLPAHAHTTVTALFFLSTERIDASYFKAPLATSKSRQTTSEDAWALFVRLCRYADNEYSNQFNISFAIVDIKCAQNYNKFEAKGIYIYGCTMARSRYRGKLRQSLCLAYCYLLCRLDLWPTVYVHDRYGTVYSTSL